MEPMHKINKVEVRNLQIEDYIQLSQSFKRVYADKYVFWTHEQIETLIRIFPEGQVVTVVDDKIVGCALSIIVDYDMVKGDHTYAKVTGNETFCTHNPEGNILYGKFVSLTNHSASRFPYGKRKNGLCVQQLRTRVSEVGRQMSVVRRVEHVCGRSDTKRSRKQTSGIRD